SRGPSLCLLFVRRLRLPCPTLFPYTTLFRSVHEGIAGICAGAHADDEHLALAEDVLSHLGGVVRVPERYMDAVTAVSGSGPAYRSEEHTSELQSLAYRVCRPLREKTTDTTHS